MGSLKNRLAAGDSGAFAELYDQVADRIFHYLLMQTGSSDDAADLLQETVVRLFRYRSRLANVENLSAYVFRSARNELMRWKRRRESKVASGDLLFEPADRLSDSVVDTREIIVSAMNELTDSHREVVELKVYAGLTFAEIAEVMRKPPGTVATWYRRALDKMRLSVMSEIE